MSLIGEFHKGEIDGKPYLLYHEVIKPLPQITLSDEETTIDKPLSIQNKTNSSDKLAIDSGDDLIPLPHLFLSPVTIINSTNDTENINVRNEYGNGRSGFCAKFHTSPLVGDNLLGSHVVLLPLYWCNNKEADPENDCSSCRAPKVGTHYYYCVDCDQRYHKECVASPLEINYPYHVKHSLQLYYSTKKYKHCILCTEKADLNLYYSSLSDIYMHVHCAQAPIPFFIDQPKRHDHTLNLFPRQASLTCNVCALVNKHSLTYVCTSCDFVAHRHCIHIPQTIRISRHYHRVSFTSFLQPGKWSCGVCRQKVDRDYGAYTCNVCSDYAVHTRCALRLDIWDGIELEGVPEEDEDVEPFERISDGIILHFSHGCHLKFGTNGVYDENKFCQACTLSINATILLLGQFARIAIAVVSIQHLW